MSWNDLVRWKGCGAFGLLFCIGLMASIKASGQQPAMRLFQVDHQQELQWKALRSNRNVRILNYDPAQYQSLKQQKPASLNMLVPGLEGQDIEIELVENKVLNEDFILSTDKARNLAYTPGLYYSGKIKGQENSMVVLTLFENEVMGMITPAGRSNIVIGNSPVLRRNSFVLFDDGQVNAPAFTCLSNELPDWTKELNLHQGGFRGKNSVAGCVKVYFECGQSVYDGKGGELGAANFVTSFYNAVSTIYAREGITTNISEIKVWTDGEPYGLGSDKGLEDFTRANTGGINGDIGHLIRLKSGTFSGLAWLDILCKTNRFAYSEVSTNHSALPAYSWTVNVIAHEMGHNLGSPHTQSCTWPGGAIDNCANPEGTCSPGPRPTDGGTIMSYCHQLSSIGVNFNNGFGPHPGNRIRDRVLAASCLTACSDGGGVVISSPDLVISSLSASPVELSSTATSSSISFNTSNTGNTVAQASKSKAFLSTDAAISSNDQTLSEFDIATIAAGANASNAFTFKFATGANPGNYFIIVCADQGGVVTETSEANNCRAVGISLIQESIPPVNPPNPPNPALTPDLTVTVNSAVPQVTTPGSVLNLAGRIFNIGPGKTTSTQLGIVVSTDGVYSSNDLVLSTSNVPALDNQGIFDFNIPVTIPAGLGAAEYQLLICADPSNNNPESDEANNCKSFKINIHIDKADLLPKDLSLSVNPSPSGSPFNILFNSLNQGVVNTNTFWAGVYLSKNNKTKDAEDLLLGQFISPDGLSPNQSRADKMSISTLINPGNYNLLVCLDDRNEISESDEMNNCAAITLTISNPVPDLIINQFVTPSEMYLGDSQTIRFTIYNQGFLKANPFKAKLSISSTPSSGATSSVLSIIDIPELGSNATIDSVIKISVNDLKWLGRPYLMLCADSDLRVKEADETNNCRDNQTWIREPLADLKLISKSIPSTPLARGSSFQFPIILTNIGKINAPASEAEIYISDKSLLKTSSSALVAIAKLDSVNKGDTLRKDLELTLPEKVSAGNYYLNICTDYLSKIKEVSKSNNCQSYKIQIRNRYTDLTISELKLAEQIVYSDLPVSLKVGVLNSGEKMVPTSGLTFFAGNTEDTVAFYQLVLDTLAVGQSWDTLLAIYLPAQFNNQEIYFRVEVDPSNLIDEVREDNNAAELTTLVFEPLPDLVALPFTFIDSSIYSGGPFHLALQVFNQGLTASGEVESGLWLIDTTNSGEPDTLASVSISHTSLLPGQPDTLEVSFELPQSIPSGWYQLWGMLDPSGQISESEESNNQFSTTVFIHQRLPDIQAVDLQLTESLSRYQEMAGILQIANDGDWQMPALQDTIYLSSDSIFTPGDKPAGIFQTGLLAPGQIQFVNFKWNIPDQVLTGTQYLILALDGQHQHPEHLETNNSLVVGIQIPAKKADLNLQGLQLAKSTIYLGDTLTITNYIENTGESNAASFDMVQFLKKHPSDTEAVFVFPSTRVEEGLLSGQSMELTSKVLLPDSINTHTYYLISCLDIPGEIDELRENNNCGQLIITINSKQGISTGLQRDVLFSRLVAFPNPVLHDLHLQGNLIQPQDRMNFSIRDYTGRILHRQSIQPGTSFDFKADLSHLPSGFYYFDLSTTSGSWKQTFIKL